MLQRRALESRYLTDEEARRLYSRNPDLRDSFEKYCPTCLKTGSYTWKDVTYQCDCKSQLNLHKQYLNAGIGVLYQRLSWDDFHGDTELREAAEDYMIMPERMVVNGIGIIVRGPYGVGKTMAMNLLCKDLLHYGFSVFATTFTAMIEMFTAGWASVEDQQHFERKVIQSQVLLLDDLGKGMRGAAKLHEHTFDHLLRSRVQSGRPTLLTTNMNTKEMENGYGSAVMSLLTEVSNDITVGGKDFRAAAGERKLAELIAGQIRPIV